VAQTQTLTSSTRQMTVAPSRYLRPLTMTATLRFARSGPHIREVNVREFRAREYRVIAQ